LALEGKLIMDKEHFTRRYKVLDIKTGKEVHGAFVLLPELDIASRTALAAYAETTINEKLACRVRAWLNCIYTRRVAIKLVRGRG
jgi:hypothetical protein